MSTLTKTFRVDGALTDMTSVTLSSADGTYGVKRNDTDEVVVADGTPMTNSATGVYTYAFEDPAYGLTYTYALEIVYGGETYHVTGTLTGPAAPSTSASQLLCTVAAVKARLDLAAGQSQHDATLASIVAGASALIAGADGAGRELCQRQRTETLNQHDPLVRALWLAVCPVVEVAEVLERWGPADLWADLTALVEDADYVVDSPSGRLIRLGVWWPQGLQVVRVTYTAGYVAADTAAADGWTLGDGETELPAELTEAAVQQAVHLFNRRRDPAAASQAVAGGNVSLAGDADAAGLLPGVRAVARRYRRAIG